MSIPSVMKAWQYSDRKGGIEKNLKLNSSAPLPAGSNSLGPDQTLVKIISTAINPVDYKVAELPLLGWMLAGTPGLDYAGRVVATGPNSGKVAKQDLKPGQLVFGKKDMPGKSGTLAEYTIVPRSGCVPLPDGVSANDAASIGTAGLTAYQCLVPNLKGGETVFINGGSGGTGIFGIQIAKTLGCYVVTSCSGANVELCKQLGADEVIDYRSQDLVQTLQKSGKKFDLVVDNVGTPNDLFYKAHTFLKPGSKYVQVAVNINFGGFGSLISRSFWPGFLGGGQRPLQFVGVANNHDEFAKVAQWMKEKKVKSVIDQVYDLQHAPQAFEKLKTGRVKGKLVVEVSDA